MVAIIGGRFGSESMEKSSSITQLEIKTALEKKKPVYIFIEEAVSNEYETYKLNIDKSEIQYRFADDIRVYEFISYIKQLPKNNPIFTFQTAQDINRILKLQWAGLFQSLLHEQDQNYETNLLRNIEESSRTLSELVKLIIDKNDGNESKTHEILFYNHPLFGKLRDVLNSKLRFYFKNFEEMHYLLNAYGYEEDEWTYDDYYTFKKLKNGRAREIKITSKLFDDEKNLRVITNIDWTEDMFRIGNYEVEAAEDDSPF